MLKSYSVRPHHQRKKTPPQNHSSHLNIVDYVINIASWEPLNHDCDEVGCCQRVCGCDRDIVASVILPPIRHASKKRVKKKQYYWPCED